MNSVEASVIQRMSKISPGRTNYGFHDPIKQRIKNEIKGATHAPFNSSSTSSYPRFSKEWLGKYAGWGAMNSIFAITDYTRSRSEGKGRLASLGSAAGWFVAGELLGGAIVPLSLGAQIPGLMVNGLNSMERMSRNMAMTNMYKNTPFFNARFQDTQPAYTMRQAGMQQAKNSQYRLEQAMMGNEAQYMRR